MRELGDDRSIALSPMLFGSGIRLFEGVDASRVALEPVRAEPSSRVTHLTWKSGSLGPKTEGPGSSDADR